MNTIREVKTVVIPYNAYIPALGINGPVEIPVTLETQKISDILSRKIPVYEVLKDNTRLKLDLINYNKKTSELSSLEVRYEPVKKKDKTNIISISDDNVKAKSMEELLKRSTINTSDTPKVTLKPDVVDPTPIPVMNVEKPKKNFINKKNTEEEIVESK